jgi:hypothetical protein
MKGKLAALKFHRDEPEGFVKEDELGIAIAVLGQIARQKLHLLIAQDQAQVSGFAVVEHGEVRVLIIEAIKRRVLGLLFVNDSRRRGPDVVIAGREVNGIAIAIPEWAKNTPLMRRGRIVVALNSVADIDDEIGMQRVTGTRSVTRMQSLTRMRSSDLLPDALVDSGLRVTGAVAQDDEAEIVLGRIRSAESGDRQRHGKKVVSTPHAYKPHARDCSKRL